MNDQDDEDIDPKFDPRLDAALEAFTCRMREKLVQNSRKVGWETMAPTAILQRLCEELAELMGTCTPHQSEDRIDPNHEVRKNRILDTQREIMLCAIEHVHCAAQLLGRFKRTPSERVTSGVKTAGEAADVANFCMFLASQL